MASDIARLRNAVRWLTAACGGLGLICAGLAWAWAEKNAEAACWRDVVEEDQTLAAIDCGP